MTNHPSLPRGRITRLVHAVTLCSLMVLSAFAADTAKHTFNIPANDAEQSLKALAAQSGREVLFVTDSTKGVRTPALQGEFTVQEALDQLLTGTPLVASENSATGAIKVRREVSIKQAEKNDSRATASSGRPEGRYETDEQGNKVLKLDTFEVFGRKTLNMDIKRSADDIQPYIVLNRDRIESSGATDIGEFLRKSLAVNTNASNNATNYSSASGDSSTGIQLRGQGALILVDGRRAGSWTNGGSLQQANLNTIPLAAVERIEVLPVSAAGIYGGNAVGGVINVILRRDYRGLEVTTTYDNTFESDAYKRRVDLAGGLSFAGGKTSLIWAGSYSDSSPLVQQDRDFLRSARGTLLRNNPAVFLGASTAALVGIFALESSSPVWGDVDHCERRRSNRVHGVS